MSTGQNNREIDMLHGAIASKLFIFAWPLVLTGVLQQLFNTADVLTLGQFIGKNAMAAVGNNTPIIGLMVSLLMGVSLGANVIIARYIGGQKPEKVQAAVHTSILLALVFSLLLMLISELFATPLLHQLGVPEEVMGMTETYLRIYLLGLPAIGLYNFEAAIFRSRGDTRTPLISLIISSVLNIVLNIAFVLGLGMDIDGVAYATLIANVVNAVYLFRGLCTTQDILHIEPRLLRRDWNAAECRRILRIGLPAGIQGMVFSLSNLVIQSAINSLGADAMAASAAAFTIEINVYCVINALGQATTTFVSQNYGAGKLKRCFRITRQSLLISALCMIACPAFLLYFGESMLYFFNSDPHVIELGVIRLFYVVSPALVNGGIEILSGALRGYGYSLPPAIVTLICICGIRITWVYTAFAASPDYGTLMAAYPLSWTATMLLLIAIYLFYRKHLQIRRLHVRPTFG